MDVMYRVEGEDGSYHGRYSKYEYAKEQAEEMANEDEMTMYIYKVTEDLVEAVMPK